MTVAMAHASADGLPTPDTVQVPDTSVTVIMVTAGAVHHELHTGLFKTYLFDREQGFNNYAGEIIRTSGANISKARNDVIRTFLDTTQSEWAWLIDSDMVIREDTLPRLLCSAAVTGAKVVGALCCMVGSDGPIPTIFQPGRPGSGEVTRVMLDYQDNALVQVAGTGMACLLVHRSVLEHFRDANPESNYPWVYEQEIGGHWVSEDVMFSLRCNAAGFPVFVDCSTEVGHAKQGSVWWPSDIRRGRGFPQPKTYAIIPTKRADADFHNLRHRLRDDSTITRIVVIDNGIEDDGLIPRADPRSHVISMPDAGIHEMWNAGVDWALKDADQRRNVNLLFLNDDLELGDRFVPNIVDALRSDADLVAVSGNYDGRSGPKVIEVEDICAGRYDGTGGFAGFAFAAKAEWFQSGYRFPEECKWWYGDNDLVLAARLVGEGKVGIAVDAPVVHLDGGSKTGGDWSQFADQLAADRIAFEQRWQQITAPVTATLSGTGEPVTVLSSIYGGYDQAVVPDFQEDVRDWVLVTDSTDVPPKPWRAIHKPREGVDPRYAAKAAKYQPFEFVDADLVVWLDGRVKPRPGFVRWLVDNLGDNDLAIYRHWGRSSIKDEAEACLIENPAKYAGRPMVEQARSYLVDGYEDVNLWQSTFFAIRRNERTLAMGKRWQEEQDRWPDCLLDQIPLPPVIAECGVKVADLPGGFWDRHGDLFVLEPHRDGT